MSSVAILPPLKRTLTDLMDEEFYQAPSSPGSVRAESPGPTPGSPQQNLSNLLNIPDSFLEQYTRMVKPNATTSQVNLVGGVSNININSPYTSSPASFSEFGLVNPFTDYADPDSLTNQRFVQPQQLSRFPTRSSRITTLESQGGDSSQKMKDEFLFNTSIEPSLINATGDDYLYSDSSLFVPQSTEINNQRIPGFENDYIVEFDEEVEDDVSDDEDDSYFHDQEDEFEMDMDVDNYFKQAQGDQFRDDTLMGGFLDNTLSAPVDQEDTLMTDDMESAPSTTSPSLFETPEKSSHLPSPDYSDDEPAAEKVDSKPRAVDVGNTCTLINPSTGRPCDKHFSRLYDLIRHQETIHASKKKIFRCVICEGRANGGAGNGREKTFSRGDALSRHIKVKHGLGGKEAVDLINEAKMNVEFVRT